MRNFLMTTAAAGALACGGVIAAVPASAADMLALGVGGYMQQWFGYADRSDPGADGGFAVHSDSEVHIKGSLESDMGLKYTVHMELEGDGANGQVDESFVRVSGEFGQIEFGFRDHAMVRMHSGIKDVGIGLTSGDTQAWIPGAYLETAGHAGTAGGGNDPKLNYISPRAAGLQVGFSYAPKNGGMRTTTPDGNDDATWGAGLNFQQTVGDINLTMSLGHRSTGQGGMDEHMIMDGSAENTNRLTMLQYEAHEAIWDAYMGGVEKGPRQDVTAYDSLLNPTTVTAGDTTATANLDGGSASSDAAAAFANVVAQARASRTALMGIDATVMTSRDDQSYTNVGFGVGFGAFSFNVAYAAADMGTSYMVEDVMVCVNADCSAVIDTNGGTVQHTWDHDGDSTTAAVQESATPDANGVSQNDPRNDYYMASQVVKAPSKDYDVLGVSVSFTDGPMSVSLGYMTHEEDSGGEREATMVSASYTMAPGVAWKSSIFSVEDTTSGVADGMNEGTGFVTGIALSF